jgi:hypothetical protein
MLVSFVAKLGCHTSLLKGCLEFLKHCHTPGVKEEQFQLPNWIRLPRQVWVVLGQDAFGQFYAIRVCLQPGVPLYQFLLETGIFYRLPEKDS